MVTAEQGRAFHDDGFVVFDPGIEPSVINDAVEKLNGLYLRAEEPPDRSGAIVSFRDDRRVQDAWKAVASIRAIATAPRILATLQELYGPKPLPFQTLNFRMGSEQKTHSDTVHFNSQPSGYMCVVRVALEDVDRENGPVVYYPGSHKWPEVALPDVDALGETTLAARLLARAKTRLRKERELETDYVKYEKVIQHRIDAAGAQPHYATIAKGQAFIWAANLLHGGSLQTDRTRTRASQVTHYVFEGCRYYTPLLQRGVKTTWRTPEWIA